MLLVKSCPERNQPDDNDGDGDFSRFATTDSIRAIVAGLLR